MGYRRFRSASAKEWAAGLIFHIVYLFGVYRASTKCASRAALCREQWPGGGRTCDIAITTLRNKLPRITYDRTGPLRAGHLTPRLSPEHV